MGGGEIEIKAKISPAKAGAWAELGDISILKHVIGVIIYLFICIIKSISYPCGDHILLNMTC